MEGASPNVANKIEAEAIVRQIAKCVGDPSYRDKTFGVISLLGEKQAELIESKLLAAIGPEEMERRRLICGDAYSFQGDERHVMFISLVVAADEGRRLATLTQAADERRFNVAASRARDQMWLFHSVNPEDLSGKCLRRRLLDYCMHPHAPQEPGETISIQELESAASTADRARAPAPPPFESWLEVDVYLQIRRRGYRVLPQHNFAGYKIDLVVTGSHGRLAVECNGEDWHGQDHYDSDMTRQRQLERCGWRFWRIRGGVFYRNPEQALQPLWELLEKQGIKAHSPVDPSVLATPAAPADSTADDDDDRVDVAEADEEVEDMTIAPAKKTPSRTRKPASKKPARRASDSRDAKTKNRRVA
jgi:very-short-patch-repair endonuclease